MGDAMKDDFLVKFWGEAPIDLRGMNVVGQLRPTELHVKADGDINNGPSLCIVLDSPSGLRFAAQISVRMLMQGLKDCPEATDFLGWQIGDPK